MWLNQHVYCIYHTIIYMFIIDIANMTVHQMNDKQLMDLQTP